MSDSAAHSRKLDQAHCWHPFTQHSQWCAPEFEPLVLIEGDGALLREYALDLPEQELEPLGEAIRCTLSGLALFWMDHPRVERSAVQSAVRRVVIGLLAPGSTIEEA